MIRWSDEPDQFIIVPRIDNDQIDDLFYQEDEIGEFRHTAFMIECGLEEEDWDGPDITPMSWPGNSDGSSSSSHSSLEPEKTALKKTNSSSSNNKVEVPKQLKKLPDRSHSSDAISEMIPVKKEPRRQLAATKSGTLHGMRAAVQKRQELEASQNSNQRLSPKSPGAAEKRGRLVATKSGTSHGLKRTSQLGVLASPLRSDSSPNQLSAQDFLDFAASPTKNNEKEGKEGRPRPSPQNVRQIQASRTKSGCLHGAAANTESSPLRRQPMRGKMIATKSGTGLKKVKRHDDKEASPKQQEDVKPKAAVKSLYDSDVESSSSSESSVCSTSSDDTISVSSDSSDDSDEQPKTIIKSNKAGTSKSNKPVTSRVTTGKKDSIKNKEEDNAKPKLKDAPPRIVRRSHSDDTTSISSGDDDEPSKTITKSNKAGTSRVTIAKKNSIKNKVEDNTKPKLKDAPQKIVRRSHSNPNTSDSDTSPHVRAALAKFRGGSGTASDILKKMQSKDAGADVPPAFRPASAMTKVKSKSFGAGADNSQLPPAFRTTLAANKC
jgi:hypothetical protein